MNTDNIPEELKSLDQWVCAWDHNKCPMSPYGYEGASSSNPETWGSFQQAYGCVEQGYYDYVGFVFCKDNGLVGIDIDTGFEDGLLTPLCVDIIKHCQSYTEKSKSGRGVHIFLRGVLPFSGRNNMDKGVEIYCEKRYFITTGKMILYDHIIENQDAIDYVVQKYFSEPSNLKRSSGKFQRYSGRIKNYTPQWKKPENGRFALNPEYPEISQGGRNVSLLSLAGQFWKAGYSESEVYKELLKVNEKCCKPPLTVGEVQRIVTSISKYER